MSFSVRTDHEKKKLILKVVMINTMVSSGRLGCCCVVGCPSNSINPLNPVENSIEEKPVDNQGKA